jgi:hypothetical protein
MEMGMPQFENLLILINFPRFDLWESFLFSKKFIVTM